MDHAQADPRPSASSSKSARAKAGDDSLAAFSSEQETARHTLSEQDTVRHALAALPTLPVAAKTAVVGSTAPSAVAIAGPSAAAVTAPVAVATAAPHPAPRPAANPQANRTAWLAGGTAMAVAAVIGLGIWAFRPTAKAAPLPPPGRLTITTKPAGVLVTIDGVARGASPVDLQLAAGDHAVVLRNGDEEKRVPLNVGAGERVSQYFEFGVAPAVAALGKLSIATDRGAGRVVVDGHAAGTTPVVLSDLTVGEHTVSITSDAGTLERRVKVEAGTTTSVVFSTPQTPANAAGWITVSSPFELQIFDGQDLIGSSAASKVMLAAGKHDLRLANAALGFTDTRHIEVAAGKTNAIKIAAPNATVSINAKPWADVFVDGASLGQTPLANVALAIGSHEIVFRHPQLGEHRLTSVVTVNGPNRVSADLTKR